MLESILQHRLYRLLVVLVFVPLFTVKSVTKEYVPNVPNPMIERWRWNELELGGEYKIYCGIEINQNEICFANEIGLLFFDGFEVRVVSYDPQLSQNSIIEPYSMFQENDGSIYLYTSIGLLLYKNGWTKLLEFEYGRRNAGELFLEAPDGSFYFGAPQGLYRIEKGDLEFIAELKGPLSSLVLTRQNEFFCSIHGDDRIFSTSFTDANLRKPETWSVENTSIMQGNILFKHEDQGDVIAVNYDQSSFARRYDVSTGKWHNIDIGSNVYGHSHVNGYYIDPDMSIIFTKTGLHICHQKKWNTIHINDWEIPINEAFLIRRKNGNLVIGGINDRIYEVDLSDQHWLSYEGLNFQCQDHEGKEWFIDVAGLVVVHDPHTDQWIEQEGDILSVPKTIVVDSFGTVWVAGTHDGEAAVSRNTDGIWKTDMHPPLFSSVGHCSAYVMSDERVFFGSGHEQNALNGQAVIYSREGDSRYRFEYLHGKNVPYRIVGIAEPKPGLLYFGGNFLASTSSDFDDDIVVYDVGELHWVDNLASDHEGILYGAIWELGLLKIDVNRSGAYEFVEALSDVRVNDVLVDRVRIGEVWVSTSGGIYRFDGESWIENAVPNPLKLNRECGLLKQSSDGSMWVNFSSREWYFRLSKGNFAERNPGFFKTVRYTVDQDAPSLEILHVDEGVSEPANVLVRWKGKDRWARTPTEDLRYSMRVDFGEWSPYGSKVETILMELPSGMHQVEIRVRDTDGNVSEIESVKFEVKPLLWKRPGFIAVVGLIIIVIVLLIWLLIRQRIRHFLQMEEFKLQFFTNISHEIRTPLTVILWPLKTALERFPESEDKRLIDTAYRNARKMSHLIDQILEFRKTQTGVMESHLVVSDVVADIRETVKLLSPLADEKRIKYSSGFSHERFDAEYDSEKIERIITNLFSNAVKYSDEMGSVSLKVDIETMDDQACQLRISMEDNGIGIRKDKIKHIFEPFYRIKDVKSTNARGVGLGLPLVKSLVDSMHGEIAVESPAVIENAEFRGTRFSVKIPIRQAAASSSHDAQDTEPVNRAHPNLFAPEYEDVLMVVEDDHEILKFIQQEFESDYTVLTASNGRDAFERAKGSIPDLIITDIMMPIMDGNQLIQKLRHCPATRHIPIIALSAQKSEGHVLKSLEKGADDYINKPASLPILRQKVSNVISTRKAWVERFKTELTSVTPGTGKQPEGSVDDEFLESFKRAVDSRMSDPEFDIEDIAVLMGMSRMSLYRKFKAITGNTPGDYIREIRMQKAAELIKQKQMSISSISDAIGFQEVANFSRAFKKRFGVSPSNYERSQ